MKFKSRKDILFWISILGSLVLFCGTVLSRTVSNGIWTYEFYWTDILMVLLIGLLLWPNFNTEYQLTSTELIYRCGPIRGKIKIERITEIIKGKTLWSGLKPATARNGLIIKYGRYEEIYISPKTNNSFISKILELNDKIIITTSWNTEASNPKVPIIPVIPNQII